MCLNIHDKLITLFVNSSPAVMSSPHPPHGMDEMVDLKVKSNLKILSQIIPAHIFVASVWKSFANHGLFFDILFYVACTRTRHIGAIDR